MIHTLSAKDRRALLIGIASITGVIAIAQGVPRWRTWDADRRVAAGSVLTRAAAFKRGLEVSPMTADSARKVARLYDTLAVALIEGQSPTAASAILAELVSAAADESGATMTTLQIRPDTIFRDRFAQIGVRMSGVGDVVTLVNLLEALEGHETLLSVRELSVSQSDPAAPEAKPETLRFHVLVEALAVTQRSSAIHSTGAK